MNVKELFDKLQIDDKPVGNVLQIQIDMERATVIYEHQKDGCDPVQRVITVESEAVTIG